MSKTLSVSAIKNGTVIDHIATGQALRIISMLRLLAKKQPVTVGLNLSSKRLKLKDLIKIENYILSNDEANDVTIFAPEATINIIKNFEVVEKVVTHLPESVGGVFACPNPICITHEEPIDSYFHIEEQGKQMSLICKYCEKAYDRNQVKVKI
jgi:aspartate carbamoyltransferase regulatory subunit